MSVAPARMMTPLRAQHLEVLMLLEERLRRERMKLADLAERDFHTFFQYFAWPVLEPFTKFQDNWHIHAMCEHLQAVTNGHIKRLLINLPFRHLKSRIVSQAWPVWEWIAFPHLQYLTASYSRDLAIRDAVDARRIINSGQYQSVWGDRFMMTSDQDVKSRYENDRRGSRTITSTDSTATGFGGNRLIFDDPQNVKQADSDAERLQSIEFFRGTMATRLNDPKNDVAVIVQQRLHQQDLSGWCLENQPGRWEHVVFPMEYERTRAVYMSGLVVEKPTSELPTLIGWTDPRTVEGELIDPRRIDAATLEGIKADIGEYHTHAQLQQRPQSRGGVIFVRDKWNFWKELPQLDETILSLDAAFKDTKTSDYVALQLWGRAGSRMYLRKRHRERLSFSGTVSLVRTWRALHPECTAVLIEDKANGSAVIDTLTLEIPGVIAINPEGGKVARAYACQPAHEAGNLWLPDPTVDPKIEVFLTEVTSFPGVPHDDETDAFTQAVNWLRTRPRTDGFLEMMRQQLAAQRADKEKAR
ncbi:MAG: phage terminase large subunit [Acidobacteria bacterium]|nr:phage terminase large subunit [Acidobacteriota bacterium]